MKKTLTLFTAFAFSLCLQANSLNLVPEGAESCAVTIKHFRDASAIGYSCDGAVEQTYSVYQFSASLPLQESTRIITLMKKAGLKLVSVTAPTADTHNLIFVRQ